MNNKLLNLATVAEMLGVSLEDVKDLIDCGDLPAVGSNKSWVRSADLNKFIGTDTAPSTNAEFPSSSDNKEDNVSITKYGEGSVYWNNIRKCYQAAFYLTMPDGSKKRKIVSGKTEVEVIGKMQMAKTPAAGAIVSVPTTTPSTMTNTQDTKPNVKFSEVANDYMESIQDEVSDNTYRNKEYMLKVLLDYFGNMDLIDIKRKTVKAFLNQYKYFDDGSLRSQASIDNMFTMLKSIFNYACNDTNPCIQKSPAYKVKAPEGKPVQKDNKTFSEEELINIFRACLSHCKYMTICALTLGAGLRSEEFVALKWSDIDFEKRKISITKASIVVKDETGGKKWKRDLGKTKTKSSTRDVYFGETQYNQLMEWKKHIQESAAYRKALDLGNADYVFINQNGCPAHVDYLRSNFKDYFSRRGLKEKSITFHKFRHSFATWARSKKVDPFVIKVWMGHSLDNDITEGTYTSVTPEMAEEASTIIDSFVAELIEKARELGAIENPKGRNGKKKMLD